VSRSLRGRALVMTPMRDRLLLVTHDAKRFWYTPGGHAQPGETLRACAEREVREETGLDIHAGRLVFVEEVLDPTLGEHAVECYFLAVAATNVPVPNWADPGGPVAQAAFFSQEALLALPAVFPARLGEEFWALLAHDFAGYDPYRERLSGGK
jgi:8-oxo-dGTP pyrophosphatase MutT (NUDIX family)